MKLKQELVNGIIKSENKTDAVMETLKTLDSRDNKIRIAMALTAGVGVYLLDRYFTNAENERLMKDLIEHYQKD